MSLEISQRLLPLHFHSTNRRLPLHPVIPCSVRHCRLPVFSVFPTILENSIQGPKHTYTHARRCEKSSINSTSNRHTVSSTTKPSVQTNRLLAIPLPVFESNRSIPTSRSPRSSWLIPSHSPTHKKTNVQKCPDTHTLTQPLDKRTTRISASLSELLPCQNRVSHSESQ